MAKTVIVGGGIGGVQASQILSGDKDQEVVLITNEDFLPYWRMRLEEVVNGADPSSIEIHSQKWYEERNISLIRGEAQSIDRYNRLLFLKDGESVGYDNLIIAMGANPVRAPIDGPQREYVLRNMREAIELRSALEEGAKSVAVIGAGLLGLELASGLAKKYSVKATSIESQSSVLPKQLDPESGDFLKKRLKEIGVHIVLGSQARYAEAGRLLLDDGREIVADVLISSIGVRPDVALAREASLDIKRGIVVDENLRTSDKNIYAIGDVAELDGVSFSLAMFARDMATHVANEIISSSLSLYIPPLPSTILKVAGIDVAVFGEKDGFGHTFHKGNGRVKIFTEENTVVGAILIDAKEYLAKARNAIGKPFEKEVFE